MILYVGLKYVHSKREPRSWKYLPIFIEGGCSVLNPYFPDKSTFGGLYCRYYCHGSSGKGASDTSDLPDSQPMCLQGLFNCTFSHTASVFTFSFGRAAVRLATYLSSILGFCETGIRPNYFLDPSSPSESVHTVCLSVCLSHTPCVRYFQFDSSSVNDDRYI